MRHPFNVFVIGLRLCRCLNMERLLSSRRDSVPTALYSSLALLLEILFSRIGTLSLQNGAFSPWIKQSHVPLSLACGESVLPRDVLKHHLDSDAHNRCA